MEDEIISGRIYRFGPFLIDTSTRQLFRNESPVHLTSKLFDILLLLVLNKGEVVTKEQLMREIWVDQFVEENNLTVNISALRKALGEEYGKRKYIETVQKQGYRFTAQVEELTSEEASNHRINVLETESGYKIKQFHLINSLAVMPISNETGDPSLEYISDQLTESLINGFSQITQLKVLARSLTSDYKNKNLDVRRIGKKLNVRTVLTGRILKLNDNLSVSVELIQVRDGFQLCSATHNLVFTDLESVQKQLAEEISRRLGVAGPSTAGSYDEIIKRQPSERYANSSEAYRLYLKGRYFMAKRTVKGIQKAIEYFSKAVELDENYSLAYSGLADCYSMLVIYGLYPPREIVPKAKTAVLRALAIDDTLAEAHTSLAKIKVNFDWDWSGAEKEYQRAIELSASYSPAYQWYGEHLARIGEFERALETINVALEIDPLSLPAIKAKAKILYLARRFDDAAAQCLEAIEIEPGYGPASGLLGYIYTAQRKYEKAIQELQKFLGFAVGDYKVSKDKNFTLSDNLRKREFTLQSDPEGIGAIGYAYAVAGHCEKAVDLLDGLRKLSKRRYVEPHAVAMICIGLGERDEAFIWLEKSFWDRSTVLTLLKTWHVLDPLREDPRFEDLYRRVGFFS